jgi:hypothetical protein
MKNCVWVFFRKSPKTTYIARGLDASVANETEVHHAIKQKAPCATVCPWYTLINNYELLSGLQ